MYIATGFQEEILNDDFREPTLSDWRLALTHQVQGSTVCKILRTQGLHPNHYKSMEYLNENYRLRSVFSTSNNKLIFFGHESNFTHTGTTNFQNLHVWANQNRCVIRSSRFQEQFTMNVWAGIIENMLIRLCILPKILHRELPGTTVEQSSWLGSCCCIVKNVALMLNLVIILLILFDL